MPPESPSAAAGKEKASAQSIHLMAEKLLDRQRADYFVALRMVRWEDCRGSR
jgi:hypothetical protein